MTGEVTAGTAGPGFRADNQPHRFTPAPADVDERVRCQVCGCERRWCGRGEG